MLRELLQHADQFYPAKVPKLYSNISEQHREDKCILCPDGYRNRRDIPALPFFTFNMTVPQARPASYPKKIKSLGDHVRAWRINNQLTQADVAKLLRVCEDTVVGWETRNISPTAKQMPGIIKLIGYLPIQIDASTLGGQINHYRFIHGLTPKEFGALIPANASTILDWEKGKHIPSKKKRLKVDEIIKYGRKSIII